MCGACLARAAPSAALVDAEVGTEVGRGLQRVQHTPVLAAVDEHRLVAAVHLDRALAVGVVPVVRHITILRESRQAVLLVPAEPLLTAPLHGIRLHGHVRLKSRRAGVNDVAVQVVFIVVRLPDAVARCRRDQRPAVVGARTCHKSSKEMP